MHFSTRRTIMAFGTKNKNAGKAAQVAELNEEDLVEAVEVADKKASKTEKVDVESNDKGKKSDKEKTHVPSPERLKALGEAMAIIKKQYGDGSIMKLGESKNQTIETIPTGAITLDLALGVGGLPRGRIIEIYG